MIPILTLPLDENDHGDARLIEWRERYEPSMCPIHIILKLRRAGLPCDRYRKVTE
jgi:hypothetical protein